jgi:hypothetical protein
MHEPVPLVALPRAALTKICVCLTLDHWALRAPRMAIHSVEKMASPGGTAANASDYLT